jgi:hypothetical protein
VAHFEGEAAFAGVASLLPALPPGASFEFENCPYDGKPLQLVQ